MFFCILLTNIKYWNNINSESMVLANQSYGHIGVIISLIILLVLMLLNWDTCFANPIAKYLHGDTQPTQNILPTKPVLTTHKEGFAPCADGTDYNALTSKGIDSKSLKIEIDSVNHRVKVAFTPNKYSCDTINVKGYMLILAKHDKDLQQVGTLNIKVSNEKGGNVLVDELKSITNKYGNAITLTTAGITKTSTPSAIANLIFGAGADKLESAAILDTPSVKIDALFDIIYAVYKNNTAKKLKAQYEELQAFATGLPATATSGTGDANYDYLAIDSTDDSKAAANLELAMQNLLPLKTYFSDLTRTGYRYQALKELLGRLISLSRQRAQGITSENSICDMTKQTCNYTFNELVPVDADNYPYYYKLGVSVVSINENGTEYYSKIMPYSFGDGNQLQFFRIDTTLEEQAKLLKRLQLIEKNNILRPPNSPTQPAAGTPKNMNAYLDMLKPHLGNYPDEFLLTSDAANELTLDKYINQSLALGQLNINVDLNRLESATTPTSSI